MTLTFLEILLITMVIVLLLIVLGLSIINKNFNKRNNRLVIRQDRLLLTATTRGRENQLLRNQIQELEQNCSWCHKKTLHLNGRCLVCIKKEVK